MRIKDLFMLFIHSMLVLIAAVAGILFSVADKPIVALTILIFAWFINSHFKNRCFGFYTGRRENCSVDYITSENTHNSENINDDEAIDTEWEEMK